MAHEYLHVWQNQYNIILDEPKSEGLCNLACQLIYQNYNNTFSNILNQNMLSNKDSVYGDGFNEMDTIQKQIGWERFIEKILTRYAY